MNMNGKLVSQFPTNSGPGGDSLQIGVAVTESQGRNPYREAAPRPPSAASANPRIAELDIDENWPASVSRDEPQKLSTQTRAHTFFVRTKKRGLMANVDVLGFIAKCPDVGDGQGVVVHRDVIQSLAYHLIDKVHELEELRASRSSEEGKEKTNKESRSLTEAWRDKFSTSLDQLGTKDAEIKELRAALGEAAVKIRRLESKLFK